MSLWDLLSNELQDYIFMFTDLSTVLLNNRQYVLMRFRKDRKTNRLFNWTEAVKDGNVILLRHLLLTGCNGTYGCKLLEKALVAGNIDAANFIWDNKRAITNLIWKDKRQRWYNRHIDKDSMERIIENGTSPIEGVTWLLDTTNESFTSWAVEKALAKIYQSNKRESNKWLAIAEKMVSCDRMVPHASTLIVDAQGFYDYRLKEARNFCRNNVP